MGNIWLQVRAQWYIAWPMALGQQSRFIPHPTGFCVSCDVLPRPSERPSLVPRQCGRSWARLPILHCQPTVPAQGPAGALLGFLCLPVSGHVLLMISRHGPVFWNDPGSLSSATVRRVLCPVGKLPCKVTGNSRKEGESLLVPLIASQRPIPSPLSLGHS